MDTLLLRQDGLWVRKSKYGKDELSPIPTKDFFYYCNHPLEIGDGVTVRTLCELTRSLTPTQLLTLCDLCEADITAFIHESTKPSIPPYELLRIEFEYVFHVEKENGRWISNSFTDMLVIGARPVTADGVQGAAPESLYSITFTPLNQLLELPIILNNKTKVSAYDYDARVHPELPEWIRETAHALSLIDVLKSFWLEVCSLGSPERRNRLEEDITRPLESEDLHSLSDGDTDILQRAIGEMLDVLAVEVGVKRDDLDDDLFRERILKAAYELAEQTKQIDFFRQYWLH